MTENTRGESSSVAPWTIVDESSLRIGTMHHLKDGSTIRVSALYKIKQESLGLESVVGEEIDRWLSKPTEHCLFYFEGVKPPEDGFLIVQLVDMQDSTLISCVAECVRVQTAFSLVLSNERDVINLSNIFASGQHIRIMLCGSDSDDPFLSVLFSGAPGFAALKQKVLDEIGKLVRASDNSAIHEAPQKESAQANESPTKRDGSSELPLPAFPLVIPRTGTVVKQLNLGDSVTGTVIKDPESRGVMRFSYLMIVFRGEDILGFVSSEWSSISEMLFRNSKVAQSEGNSQHLMLCSYVNSGHVNHGSFPNGNNLKEFLGKAIPIAQRIANIPEIDIETDINNSDIKADETANSFVFVFGFVLLVFIVIILSAIGYKS